MGGFESATLAEQLAALQAEVATLRAEVAGRRNVTAAIEPEPEPDVVSRRQLLRRVGGAAAAGLGAAVVADVLGASPAAAASGTFDNSANSALPAVTATATGAGSAVEGTTTGTGRAVMGQITNAANTNAAVYGATDGTGQGVRGFTTGTSNAVAARTANPSNGSPSLEATTNGTGSAIFGEITNVANTSQAVQGTTSGGGIAVGGLTTGAGGGVSGQISNAANTYIAVAGHTNGTGDAVRGTNINPGSGRGVLGFISSPTNAGIAVDANTNGTGPALRGLITNLANAQPAVYGNTNGTGDAVLGLTSGTGPGVRGRSIFGVGVSAEGGRAQLLLVPDGSTGAPTTGVHTKGEVFVDANGDQFLCKVGNGTGVGTWMRMGFNPIDPTRIVDTRSGAPMAPGAELLVSIIGVAGIPVGATSVTLNVTVVAGPASDGGFMSLYPANQTYSSGTPPTFSNVNFSSSQIVANSATIKLAPPGTTNAGKIKVFNMFGSNHVILDVAGFFS